MTMERPNIEELLADIDVAEGKAPGSAHPLAQAWAEPFRDVIFYARVIEQKLERYIKRLEGIEVEATAKALSVDIPTQTDTFITACARQYLARELLAEIKPLKQLDPDSSQADYE